jgi:predicted DNA-binding transcriptional regulator YafY
MEISLYVVLNYELEQRILSYGSTIQVMEPESLKQKILLHARAMTKLYE